jgi:hypothetical protein
MHSFQTIEDAVLTDVTGGASLGSYAQSAWDGVKSGAGAVNNFANGFAGGAIYGPTAKDDQISQFGDRNSTGFAPGVETGMMFNQAMGPVGDLISAGAGAVPTP